MKVEVPGLGEPEVELDEQALLNLLVSVSPNRGDE